MILVQVVAFLKHESLIYLQFCEIWFWFKLS